MPSVWGDSVIDVTWLNVSTSGGVTSRQVAPPSSVTCTSPSSDPAISTPSEWADAMKAKIVAYISAPAPSLVSGPESPIVSGSAWVRSSLIASHE